MQKLIILLILIIIIIIIIIILGTSHIIRKVLQCEASPMVQEKYQEEMPVTADINIV